MEFDRIKDHGFEWMFSFTFIVLISLALTWARWHLWSFLPFQQFKSQEFFCKLPYFIVIHQRLVNIKWFTGVFLFLEAEMESQP